MSCVNSFGDEQLAVDLLADKLLFEALKFSVGPGFRVAGAQVSNGYRVHGGPAGRQDAVRCARVISRWVPRSRACRLCHQGSEIRHCGVA